MKAFEYKPLIELIHLQISWNPNTSNIDYNLKINSNYTLDHVSRLLTKEICKRSDKSRELKRESDILMDVRSMLKQ